ncbi:nuclease-related domain-containing protein [Actinomadura sp. WAC 06369]|uniref:nuclease-related domain-containing protein n=1 Tax=Actinomadura sp. WAC 06369 TaxID=2203193 RepID=UPI000F78F67D|nr:nuclease-related domain-containing protein [Actinomadura sp. WAC 06369]RSN51126.1 hypothetical protein DMH08_31360 [Actinomadura sp. WAC 06369]
MARTLAAAGRRRRAKHAGLSAALIAAALLLVWLVSGSLQIGVGAAFLAVGLLVVLQGGRRTDDAAKWRKGAVGERSTARMLRPLERRGYVVLHDRGLGRADDVANIDHLVIGPGGVIVVDSKNWHKNTMIRRRRGQIWVGRTRGAKVVAGTAVERRRVSTVLTMELGERLGRPVEAQAVLAVHGAKLPYWRRPEIEGIPLLRARSVRRWITSLPAVYDQEAVTALADAATRRFPPYEPPEHRRAAGNRY